MFNKQFIDTLLLAGELIVFMSGVHSQMFMYIYQNGEECNIVDYPCMNVILSNNEYQTQLVGWLMQFDKWQTNNFKLHLAKGEMGIILSTQKQFLTELLNILSFHKMKCMAPWFLHDFDKASILIDNRKQIEFLEIKNNYNDSNLPHST